MSDTTPLAEAIELLLNAGKRYLDGPGEALRRAAVRVQPGAAADTVASEAAHVGLVWLDAAFAGMFLLGDALAILAEPPTDIAEFRIPVRPADIPTNEPLQVTVRPGSFRWLWSLGPTPVPNPVVGPLTQTITSRTATLRLQPRPLVSACSVVLDVTRPTSGETVQLTVPLDVTTQVFT